MARSQKKHEAVASASDSSVKAPAQAATVSGNDVAGRAYDLYLARGREPGHDVDDWLQAEREFRSATSVVA